MKRAATQSKYDVEFKRDVLSFTIAVCLIKGDVERERGDGRAGRRSERGREERRQT